MDLLFLDKTNFPVPIGFYINWIHGIERKQTFALQCPKCQKAFCLANHTVEDKGDRGIVSPSVVCPFNCGFHEFLVLK